jgi:hypothetical protein
MTLFGPELYRHLAAATQHEWLETNGLGGCALPTLIGLHTQRSHGLLTAALPCVALYDFFCHKSAVLSLLGTSTVK